MPIATTRRGMLLGAPGVALAALTGFDPALAQTPTGVLRVAMTASAVPLSNGCPDQGAEGQRFMGITTTGGGRRATQAREHLRHSTWMTSCVPSQIIFRAT